MEEVRDVAERRGPAGVVVEAGSRFRWLTPLDRLLLREFRIEDHGSVAQRRNPTSEYGTGP